jgi:hypothetical protein
VPFSTVLCFGNGGDGVSGLGTGAAVETEVRLFVPGGGGVGVGRDCRVFGAEGGGPGAGGGVGGC